MFIVKPVTEHVSSLHPTAQQRQRLITAIVSNGPLSLEFLAVIREFKAHLKMEQTASLARLLQASANAAVTGSSELLLITLQNGRPAARTHKALRIPPVNQPKGLYNRRSSTKPRGRNRISLRIRGRARMPESLDASAVP